MTCTQSIVVLVGKLYQTSPELSEILIDKIGKLVARKHRLILQDAHITPCIYDLGLDIPQCRIANEICAVVEESGRTDHLPVPRPLDVHHLGGLRAHEPYKTVLLVLLLCKDRKAHHQGKKYIGKSLDHRHLSYSALRNFSYHASRSKTQSSNIGSSTI